MKPNDASAGSPSSSLSQLPATSSDHRAPTGASTPRPAFWSQVEVSQSAASAAGTDAADHEAEVAPAGGGHDTGLGVPRQLLDDLQRVGALLGERTAERRPELVDRGLREDAPRIERVDEVGGELRGAQQQLTLVHGASLRGSLRRERGEGMSFRKYELGSYEEMCAAHRWEVPERYNIARDVCDKHDRDRLAMVWEDWQGNERRVSFGELQDLSNRFANVLEAIGVERGDRVATLLPSLPETAAVFLGTYKRGAILLSMSVLYGDEGIQHRLRDSGAKAVVTDSANRHRIPEGLVEKVLVMGGEQRGRRRRLRRRDEPCVGQLRDGRHGRRRPRPALLLVRHHRQGQGHPARPPLPARPRGVRVLPRRARRRALPRLRRVGLGGRHLPAARPVALRGRGARAGAQGRLRPRGAPALPLQARRAEHVHHAHRAAGDDRRGGRRQALPARRSCASPARPASRSTPR